ncbi:MAG: ketopantoate reductase family protein [Actinomycetota bacterium]
MKTSSKRILIFGAGVIGSTYGGRLALCGHDVTILARNERFGTLIENGLLLQAIKEKKQRRIQVKVIAGLNENDLYDYVLVCLRNEQVASALPVLAKNQSNNFVFMVNNPSGYTEWTEALGSERVIPAFPGSGGKLVNGVVHYELLKRIIQPTTIGEINGKKSARITELRTLFIEAGFTTIISSRMDAWQKNHVALVGPLGLAIYMDGGDNYSVAKNPEAIRQMNLALKENFNFLKRSGIGIVPGKFKIFIYTPLWLLDPIMRRIFDTKWAATVISNHALNARKEMRVISSEFIEMARGRGYLLKEFDKLLSCI